MEHDGLVEGDCVPIMHRYAA